MMQPLIVLAGLIAAALAAGPALARDVTESDIAGFVASVQSCWALAPEDAGSGKRVKVRVALNPDGSVAHTKILEPDKSAAGQRLAVGAIRALQRCAPYSFPTESYQQWKIIDVELRP